MFVSTWRRGAAAPLPANQRRGSAPFAAPPPHQNEYLVPLDALLVLLLEHGGEVSVFTWDAAAHDGVERGACVSVCGVCVCTVGGLYTRVCMCV